MMEAAHMLLSEPMHPIRALITWPSRQVMGAFNTLVANAGRRSSSASPQGAGTPPAQVPGTGVSTGGNASQGGDGGPTQQGVELVTGRGRSGSRPPPGALRNPASGHSQVLRSGTYVITISSPQSASMASSSGYHYEVHPAPAVPYHAHTAGGINR